MGGHIFWRTSVAIFMTATLAILLTAAASIANSQSVLDSSADAIINSSADSLNMPQPIPDTSVDAVVNWQDSAVIVTIDTSINIDALNRAAALTHAEIAVNSRLALILPPIIQNIRFNSLLTIGQFLEQDPAKWGSIINLIEGKSPISIRPSNSSRTVSLVYRINLYPDLIAPFIDNSNPSPIPYSIGWTPSQNFSGAVIYAAEPLPAYGQDIVVSLQPALLPDIYDENLNDVLLSEMVDQNAIIQRGVVGYTNSVNPDDWRERVGDYPILIVAVAIWGERNSDILIPKLDADRLLSRTANRNLLQEGKVLVIIGNAGIESLNNS